MAIIPIQDIMELGSEARMNTPGLPMETGNGSLGGTNYEANTVNRILG